MSKEMLDQQEEERLEAEIIHLNELHKQLRHLRSLAPRFTKELKTPAPTQQEYTKKAGEAVDAAQWELDDFKKAWTNDQTQAILKKGEESRKANPMGIMPWMPTDDFDWMDRKPRKPLQSDQPPAGDGK